MSRLAKKPIPFPESVSLRKENGAIHVKGPEGELSVNILKPIHVDIAENGVKVSLPKEGDQQARSNLGTTTSLIRNAIKGVTDKYQKELVMKGVGYGASVSGNTLVLDVGYSHAINFEIPDGVEITAEKTNIAVSGIDKALVGEVAAKVRSFRKPEPYQGSGIRYKDEVIRRKVGKKAAAAGGVTA